MTAKLKARVTLNKLDLFRDLLEEHRFVFASSTHLRNTKSKMSGRDSIMGEWKSIIGKFIDKNEWDKK